MRQNKLVAVVGPFRKEICALYGIPEPVAEHQFHPTRKWRFDFAWPTWKLAVEIEGGARMMGRHNREPGFVKDMEKYNSAVEAGWALLRYQPLRIDYGQVKRVLVRRGTE